MTNATRPRPTRTRPRASELARTREEHIAQGNIAISKIDPEIVAKMLGRGDTDDQRYRRNQPRYGEVTRAVSPGHQIRAIFADPWFWKLTAVLPINNLKDQKWGRRRHYPSWLLFGLAHCVAGLRAYKTQQGVATALEDQILWATIVHYADQYVPDDWTKLHECTHAKRRELLPKARTQKVSDFQHARHRRTERRQHIRHLIECPDVAAPKAHHLDYFDNLVRGCDKNGKPLPPTSPWVGVLARVNDTFERCSIDRAQQMGVLDPQQPFQWHHADRDQYVKYDGTVFPMPLTRAERHAREDARLAKKTWRTDPDSPMSVHDVAGGAYKQYGSKWTIGSVRVDGQPGSRVYLQAAHTSASSQSDYNDESAAVLAMAPRIRDLTRGGMKGILVDSIVRGRALACLQRNEGIVVVNYPHAESNSDRGSRGRLNQTRVEKSHLRTCAEHTGPDGITCRHLIFAIGGELADLVETADGGWTLVPVNEEKYQARESKPRRADTCQQAYCAVPDCADPDHRIHATRREYKIVTIKCEIAGAFQTRIPLFHTDATSAAEGTDPDYNWGEVCRTFAPSSAAFKYLYGGRNEAESRHNDLKDRIKYLTRDVAGQRLRVIGAMFASNAQSWQIHQQLHGEPNVIDNTA